MREILTHCGRVRTGKRHFAAKYGGWKLALSMLTIVCTLLRSYENASTSYSHCLRGVGSLRQHDYKVPCQHPSCQPGLLSPPLVSGGTCRAEAGANYRYPKGNKMKTLSLVGTAICSLLVAVDAASAQSTNFVLSATLAVGNDPRSVVAVDVNGDGKVDLVCANAGVYPFIGTLTVLTNDGNGGFGFNATLSVGARPSCVVAADINGDGNPDLISANSWDGTLTVLTNDGTGIFGSNATLNVGSQPVSLVAVDVNGDGKPDLVTGNSGGTLTVLTNNGSGIFGFNATLSATYDASVVAADFNGDLRPDLACVNSGNGGRMMVLMNNGSGVFTSNQMLNAGSYLSCVTAADINGDGKVDLICASAIPFYLNGLMVFTNIGSGFFGYNSNAIPFAITGLSWVSAADVNKDGKVDLICANHYGNTLMVLTNNGNGIFGSNATLNLGSSVACVIAADVNGDGKPDLISANGNGSLTVLTNATVIPVPPLNIVPVGNQVALFWPVAPQNFILQTATNLASTNWTAVTNGTQNICVTLTNLSPAAFFRLQMQ